MGLIESELSIITIKELLELELSIPEYQRPYSWGVDSTNILFSDTYESFKQHVDEYRLGSIILHKDRSKYNIVDGQQRITTLSILLYALGDQTSSLMDQEYSFSSTDAIIDNLQILRKKISELNEDQRGYYREYLLKKCTVVKIVTEKEQEAFQFFDSQNSRGKELAPHDLLKSYHLREMDNEEEEFKIKTINNWENTNQDRLKDLFEIHLFPLTQWYRSRNGLGYSSKKIGVFKGIKGNNTYNHTIYQKASNLFIEQMNNNGGVEILGSSSLNQFQLIQPLIAGKRFFSYTLHYDGMLEKVRQRISIYNKGDQLPRKRTGDRYTKNLYENILLFFADRFGIEQITDSVMAQLYTWAYSIRLVMTLVFPETINKYAIGGHERINKGMDLFTIISEMNDPGELNLLVFEKIDEEIFKDNIEKYPDIWEFIKAKNGW